MELLKGFSPASIDSEFRNMAPDAGGSVEWMENFMEFLLDQLKTNENYELVQSYLGLFLKVRIMLREHSPPSPNNDAYCHKLMQQI
jgi:U3 small nucleolar RNA-associated protein 21